MEAFELPPVPLCEDPHGVIRVKGTRVTLESVVTAFERGATPEETTESYPSLSLSNVYSTLAYVLAHRANIEASCW